MMPFEEFKPEELEKRRRRDERRAKIACFAYGTLLGLIYLFGETISYKLF